MTPHTRNIVLIVICLGGALFIAGYRELRMRPMPASAYHVEDIDYTRGEIREVHAKHTRTTWLVLWANGRRYWLHQEIWKGRYTNDALEQSLAGPGHARIWQRAAGDQSIRGLHTDRIDLPPELGVRYDRGESLAALGLSILFFVLGLALAAMTWLRMKVTLEVQAVTPGTPPSPTPIDPRPIG